MRILVLNAGSSSLKLELLDGDRTVAKRLVERWAGPSDLSGLESFLDGLDVAPEAVGHRVAHGGPRFRESVEVDAEVLDYLDSISDLAPLHNPPAVATARAVGRLLPDLPAVACFDTAFHADLPPAARTYALPREWNQRWGLRRYGFHGLSHASAVRRAAELVGRPLESLRIVSCHLGAGASLAAVAGGRSVDTTMGFTPLEGLVMQTRSGSVDPGLLLWLIEQGHCTPAELSSALTRRSGLAGLSGTSGDLRDVLGAQTADAALAYDVFVHRLVREIGAMTASAGGLDVLLITGGIGEHSAVVRRDVAQRLAFLGVALDRAVNESASGDADLSAAGAAVRTLVVQAKEEAEIARETRRLLS